MLYLFNTTICPNEGLFRNKKITVEDAKQILDKHWEVPDNDCYRAGYYGITSALGHQGSADVFNILFPNLNCQVNRIQATMQPGDEAICLKVIGRLPEGQILTLEELEKLGFEFYLLSRVE